MAQDNLSEILFKPTAKHTETSTLVRRCSRANQSEAYSVLEGDSGPGWYRTLNRVMWIWRGIDPIELELVLSRIAASNAPRSNDKLLDTVIGYRSGNWVYEWTHQGMEWQKKAIDLAENDPVSAGHYWQKAASFYGIASYPHLKGDELAEQAVALANRACEEAAKLLPYEVKALDIPVTPSSMNPNGGSLKAFLHMPNAEGGPYPTVIMCNGFDNLQSDYIRLFHDYLAPAGIAMLCLDMPSIGFSSPWLLTQDSSFLHQQVLNALPSVPWVDHQRVALLGMRFGANIAVRLAYLEQKKVRAVACIGPIVHHLLSNAKSQMQVPPMYMDILASRLGMPNATDAALQIELSRYSLKMQGLLGRRCSTPMLGACWEEDIFSPLEESKLIANSSFGGTLLKIPSKPVYDNFYHSLKDVCSWLENKLR